MSRRVVPKLRFPEFQGEAGWELLPIGQKVDLLSGYPFESAEILSDPSGIKLLRGINITEGEIRHSTEIDRYFLGNVEQLKQFIVRTNDLVIAMDGSKVGKNFALINAMESGALLVQRVARLRASSDILIRFVSQVVGSSRFHSYVDKVSTSSGIPHISGNQINEFGIFFPSLAEQSRIAACLSSLDDLVAAHQKKLDTLRTHKKGLMQQLFPGEGETVPRLRFPDFQGDWQSVALIQLLANPPEYGVNAPAVPYSEKFPTYLRITDIGDDGQFLAQGKSSVDIEAKEEHYLANGDIVLARTGASVGKSYRYLERDGHLVFAGFLIRIRPNKTKIVPTLLSNFLTTQQYWDWVSMISTRSGQPGVNGTEYSTLSVPVPPPSNEKDELAEQQQIAACLSSMDDQITTQTQLIDALKQHKRGLMQQLFPALNEESEE